jgi:cyanophycinase-like exopeptidase
MGIIALVGGDEFRVSCAVMDKEILLRIGRRPARVLILPTAAAHSSPELAAANGVRYFQMLGAIAEAAMVLTHADADDPSRADLLRDADLVYLTGGDPRHLLETLSGTALQRALEAFHSNGGAVAGSSAGAMVLGERVRRGQNAWVPGLGLAGRVAVLPHHEHACEANVRPLRESLAPSFVLFGIAAATACITSDDDQSWRVAGTGSACVYSAYTADRYVAGQSFELP